MPEDGSARIHVRRSKTGPDAEGTVLYIGPNAARALAAIMPEGFAVVDPSKPVSGLSTRQIGRRVNAAAKAAGLGDGFTGRVGMAQDLARTGAQLPALMTAGRWKSSTMPAPYTERQAADRSGVARYYLEIGGKPVTTDSFKGWDLIPGIRESSLNEEPLIGADRFATSLT